MDNLFLSKILKEHARLIIPGFGAFLRKEGPTTALVFSPFLKKDDGVLCGLLCEEYGVSNFDGEGMIAEWVQHIREALASNGKYHIEGVGLLVLDANGAIAMVEEPARKPAPAAQPVAAPAPAPSPQPAAVQPRPLVQPEPVVSAAPAPAQSTIAQQIVEQIQQAPARPVVAPQPIGQAAPRVAPRPIATQGTLGGVNPAAPQGMGAPRPAAPVNPNNPRPAGAPQGAPQPGVNPHGAQQIHPGAPRPAGAPQPGNAPQGAPGHAPQRPQGAPGMPPRGQRPPQRPARKAKKYSSIEIWLITAIVAALVVTGIIIWSLLVLSPKQEFYTTDQITVDSTTVVDTVSTTNTPAN